MRHGQSISARHCRDCWKKWLDEERKRLLDEIEKTKSEAAEKVKKAEEEAKKYLDVRAAGGSMWAEAKDELSLGVERTEGQISANDHRVNHTVEGMSSATGRSGKKSIRFNAVFEPKFIV